MYNSFETVDDVLLLLENGVTNVANKFLEINATNYFPVNDGDTGNNLKSTLINALHKVKKPKCQNIESLLATFCEALLVGAVGNSGIAFASSFSGFCKNFNISSSEKIGKNWLKLISKGWTGATKSAYLTFNNMQEGTMGTLIRVSGKHLKTFWNGKKTPSIKSIFSELYFYLKDQLPKLTNFFLNSKNKKFKNHIDAGALGFFYFIEGLYLYVCNHTILHLTTIESEDNSDFINFISCISKQNDVDFTKSRLGYCIEKIIQISQENCTTEDHFQKLKNDLNGIGATSVIVSKINYLVKIHCHHLEPAKVIEICSKVGAILKSKIENMALQNFIFQKKNQEKQLNITRETRPKCDNNIICFSSCKSWENKMSKLKIFGNLNVKDGLVTSEAVKKLFKKISTADNDHFLVLLHNANDKDTADLEEKIQCLFAETDKKYHLLKYQFSFECYMAAISYSSLKLATKKDYEKSLYAHRLWSTDNIIIYLVPADKKIKVVVNGENIKHIKKISDLKIRDILKFRKKYHSIDDFEEVMISEESQSDPRDTKYLQKLFSSSNSDLTIQYQQGDDGQIAYTILIT